METAVRPKTFGKACLMILAAALLALSPLPGLCRPPIPNDKAVKRAVEAWIKARLPRPESYRSVAWSRVVPLNSEWSYKYAIRHRYRYRHPLDGYYVIDCIFMFDYNYNIEGVESLQINREPAPSRQRP